MNVSPYPSSRASICLNVSPSTSVAVADCSDRSDTAMTALMRAKAAISLPRSTSVMSRVLCLEEFSHVKRCATYRKPEGNNEIGVGGCDADNHQEVHFDNVAPNQRKKCGFVKFRNGQGLNEGGEDN